MNFVLDASVTLAWCFQDEETQSTRLLLDRLHTEKAFVPSLWTLEIGNILLSACRKKRLSHASAMEFLNLVQALDIQIDEATAHHGFHDIFSLAHSEQLTTYDAAYLELAMRLGLPLATRDVQLANAAGRVGVIVL
ncbi:MAG: type II toxin-antitoxin system VapC family toxin [Gammaproteobacteria bacterium]|nr:type II toxin-antitoxin system VapC family toxin [Gammaproteobacteria bacterium]